MGSARLRRGWILALALCAASGLLGAASFAPVQAWPLAWVALAPMFWVVFARPGRQGIIGAWLTGSVLVAAVMYWVARFGYLPWLLLAAVEGLAAGAAAACILIARPAPGWRRILFAAVSWTAWDWLRTLGRFGVPWAQIGQSQIPALPIAQVASVAGIDGLTFLVALFSAAVADAIACCAAQPGALRPSAGWRTGGSGQAAVPHSPVSLKNWRSVIIVAAFAAIAAAWGDFRIISIERGLRKAPSLRVAMIQASVETDLTGSDVDRAMTLEQREEYLSVNESLSTRAAKSKPGLIIWPESSLPGNPLIEADIMACLSRVARRSRAWLIAGGHRWVVDSGDAPAYVTYNSAFLVNPDGALRGIYDKVHLVPFGEYVPGRKWLPLVNRYPVLALDTLAGKEFVVWRCAARVGPMICFESVFPYISRALRRKGAQLLVVITNDAWFGLTAAAEQHMQIGRFRAIEEGVSVARAATSGISCAISPTGRIISRTLLAERSALVADVPIAAMRTVYGAIGPAFPFVCLAAAIGVMVVKAVRRSVARGGNE
jgi:apolipoprotein N-acyltransferase